MLARTMRWTNFYVTRTDIIFDINTTDTRNYPKRYDVQVKFGFVRALETWPIDDYHGNESNWHAMEMTRLLLPDEEGTQPLKEAERI